jgi:surfeit locus 1 family protein
MSPKLRFLPLLFGLLSALLFVRLGIWQLSRLRERRARNAAAESARQAAPADLNRAPRVSDSALADRAVMVRGQYDRSREIVVRNHVYRDAPGIWLFTPLRIAGSDSAVLVNRGFVPAPDAVTADVDTLDEPGELTVRGVAVPIPDDSDGEPLERNGLVSWKRLDLAALRSGMPYPMLGISILQSPDSSLPARPIRLAPPALDDGPHLSYAVQWFSYATIAVVGGILLTVRGTRRMQPAE